MLVFLDDQRRRALAHDEAVTRAVERPAGARGGFALPLAHRLDDGERAEGQRTERRLGGPGDDHVGKTVADVAQRLAHGHRAAGATVRVRRAHPAQAKLDGDVRVRRPAEYLQGERLVDAARAFFEEVRVLEFRARDAAERRAEADPRAGLRVVG